MQVEINQIEKKVEKSDITIILMAYKAMETQNAENNLKIEQVKGELQPYANRPQISADP